MNTNTALKLTEVENTAAAPATLADLTVLMKECTKAMEVIAGSNDETVAKTLADGMTEILKALAKRIEG